MTTSPSPLIDPKALREVAERACTSEMRKAACEYLAAAGCPAAWDIGHEALVRALAVSALLSELEALKGENERLKAERDDIRDRLRDVVMIDAEEWALSGGGPGIAERRETAWTRAREPFEP